MKDVLPGLDRVRERFLSLLEERQAKVAEHTIAAWEASSAEDVTQSLAAAQGILHQISGTAGSLGFAPLGTLARESEEAIILHLKSPQADFPDCPDHLVQHLDRFISECNVILSAAV